MQKEKIQMEGRIVKKKKNYYFKKKKKKEKREEKERQHQLKMKEIEMQDKTYKAF